MKLNGTPLPSGEGKRSAAASPADLEVSAKATRRRFAAAYKLSVVEKADACDTPGKIGELLRREGLLQFAPVVVAEGGAGGVATGAGEEARPEVVGREA